MIEALGFSLTPSSLCRVNLANLVAPVSVEPLAHR